MAVGGQRLTMAALPAGMGGGAHCTGGSRGRGAISGRVRKMWPQPEFEPRIIQPVA
jgi:hypothetical protein